MTEHETVEGDVKDPVEMTHGLPSGEVTDPRFGEDSDRQILELLAEQAQIRKRIVDLGGVRLRTVTETFDEVIPTELVRSTVDIRRVPVNRVVDHAPEIREENGVTIIPVLEERPVMRTELVLVEEVHITRNESRETVDVPVTLRRQHVVEERLEPQGDLQDDAL